MASAPFPGNMIADGRFYGSPLTVTQRALKRGGYPNVVARGYYGSNTKKAIWNIQKKAGLVPTGNIGRRVWAIIDAHFLNAKEKAQITAYVRQKRAEEAKAAALTSRSAKVGRIIDAGLVMISHAGAVHYTQSSLRMQGVRKKIRLPNYPVWEDCSSSCTWLYWQADAPDPNGFTPPYPGWGWTGTLRKNGKQVSLAEALPGDLVFYGPGPDFTHVACVLKGSGREARCFSHGSERGPLYVNIGYRPVSQVRRYPLS